MPLAIEPAARLSSRGGHKNRMDRGERGERGDRGGWDRDDHYRERNYQRPWRSDRYHNPPPRYNHLNYSDGYIGHGGDGEFGGGGGGGGGRGGRGGRGRNWRYHSSGGGHGVCVCA